MTDKTPIIPSANARADKIVPILTEAEIARIAAHGRARRVQRGEVLVEAGIRTARFFVVTAGQIEIVRLSGATEDLLAVYGPGMFTGEVTLLSGRRGLAQIRAGEAGEVIEVDREHLQRLVQTDSELSDILMRAFILRRVELIAHGFGDVLLIGSRHCAGTLRVKEFLTRNGNPYSSIDLDSDADVQELLDHFHVTAADVPVVICRGEVVLRNPTNQQIAECLGFNTEPTKRKRFGGATKAAHDDDDGHEVIPRLSSPTDEEDDMATAMNRIERMGRIESNAWGIRLEDIGKIIIRYGLVVILLWIGALKFTAYEAQNIQGLVANSPLMSWVYSVMTTRGFSALIGVIEITLGILIALRPISPKLSAIGSLGAIGMFLVTLSFILTTPGVWQQGYGFPFPSSSPGQFLLKDLVNLGAATYTAGEALHAARL